QISSTVVTENLHTMYYHMQMYFANGGGPCYIVSVGNTLNNSVSKDELKAGLDSVRGYDEPTLLVCPQLNFLADSSAAGDIYESALDQAGDLQDRFAIFDCFGNVANDSLREKFGTENLKYGAVYHPFLRTSLSYKYDLAELDITYNLTEDGNAPVATTPDFDVLSTEHQNLIKTEVSKLSPTLPPSSSVAGVYANVDSKRGVWKAPANVSLARVIGPSINITEL